MTETSNTSVQMSRLASEEQSAVRSEPCLDADDKSGTGLRTRRGEKAVPSSAPQNFNFSAGDDQGGEEGGDEDSDKKTQKRLRYKVDVVEEGAEPVSLQVVGTDSDEEEEEDTLMLYESDIGRGKHITQVIESAESGGRVPFADTRDKKKAEKANLGTIFGVFFPCLQNIFGVIYFIRLPWMVGTAGTMDCFFIVFLCCAVMLLTSISMSAIATNGRVTAGGTYFMISRSLGPEFGGAVGLLFYCGLSISVAMYLLGTVETLLKYVAPAMSLHDDFTNSSRLYGTILVILLSIVVFIGVKFVAIFGAITLSFVLISIFCVFIGFLSATPERGVKVCFLGDRLLATKFLIQNGTVRCDKKPDGPAFKAYCPPSAALNDSLDKCDPYFATNTMELKAGIPGLSSGNIYNAAKHYYSDKGHIPATEIKANKNRGDISTDLQTSFMVLLAIYFPSITGFEQGSAYSGDLRDAQKSIPLGTLAAVFVSSTVYLSTVIFYGACVEGALLRDKFGESMNYELLIAMTGWPTKWVLYIGTLQSTVGAGLQALAGAPRLMNAIAKDGVLPFLQFFGAITQRGEPFRAQVLTFAIAEVGILIANLDYVAPIVTQFFLMCYGFINLACTIQTLLRSPHWRPRFRFHHWLQSLIAVALCIALMFICDWKYALPAVVMAGFIYKYIEYKGAERDWGDGMQGLGMYAATHALLRMRGPYANTKNWRPQVLLTVKLDDQLQPRFPQMLALTSQLKAGRGLTIVLSVLQGNFQDGYDHAMAAKKILNDYIDWNNVRGFSDVVVSRSVVEGLSCAFQTSGLGQLKPNTVMMAWPSLWARGESRQKFNLFINTVKNVAAAQMALVVVKNPTLFPKNSEKLRGTIDVWWIVHDGGLLMLLPFLLKKHRVWRNCLLRIFTVAQMRDNSVRMKKDLQRYVYDLRIDAEVEVIEMGDHEISAYIYERTLQMAERNKLIRELGAKKVVGKEPQSIIDEAHKIKHLGRFTMSAVQDASDDEEDDGAFDALVGPPPRQRRLNRSDNYPHPEGNFFDDLSDPEEEEEGVSPAPSNQEVDEPKPGTSSAPANDVTPKPGGSDTDKPRRGRFTTSKVKEEEETTPGPSSSPPPPPPKSPPPPPPQSPPSPPSPPKSPPPPQSPPSPPSTPKSPPPPPPQSPSPPPPKSPPPPPPKSPTPPPPQSPPSPPPSQPDVTADDAVPGTSREGFAFWPFQGEEEKSESPPTPPPTPAIPATPPSPNKRRESAPPMLTVTTPSPRPSSVPSPIIEDEEEPGDSTPRARRSILRSPTSSSVRTGEPDDYFDGDGGLSVSTPHTRGLSPVSALSASNVQYTFSGSSAANLRNMLGKQNAATLQAGNLKRMHTAVELNHAILAKSSEAELVILNLPPLPSTNSGQENYMSYMEALTEGLGRVLLIRGSNREVITIFN